jgi:hypothetical protein
MKGKKRIGSTTCFEKCSNSLMEEEEEDDLLDFLFIFYFDKSNLLFF